MFVRTLYKYMYVLWTRSAKLATKSHRKSSFIRITENEPSREQGSYNLKKGVWKNRHLSIQLYSDPWLFLCSIWNLRLSYCSNQPNTSWYICHKIIYDDCSLFCHCSTPINDDNKRSKTSSAAIYNVDISPPKGEKANRNCNQNLIPQYPFSKNVNRYQVKEKNFRI